MKNKSSKKSAKTKARTSKPTANATASEALVKQVPRQKETECQKSVTLEMTPALAQDAQALVSIYDRIDWDRANQSECDAVKLYLQSNEAVETANRIWLEIAADNLGQRNALIGKIKQAFKSFGSGQDRGKTEKPGSDQEPGRSAHELLDDLIKAHDPARFSELCIQAALLYDKRSAECQPKLVAGTKRLPPLTANPQCWLGSVGDLWMSVPLHLALAEKVVGICRRITEVNTGETVLNLNPSEALALEQHQRYFRVCKPESYHVSGDDPICCELQEILNKFVPALRNLVDACLKQITTVEPSAAKPTKNTEAKSTPDRALGSGQIEITDKMIVIVNGVRITNTGPANALLALAALAEDGKPDATINTDKFVLLSHRVNGGVAKQWNINKKWLESYGLIVGLVRDGVWLISNFQIKFADGVSRQKIAEYLKKLSPRVRAPKAASS